MKALSNRLARAIGPNAWLKSGCDALARRPGLFASFDANASAMTVGMASAQVPAMRNAMTAACSAA